MVAFALDQNGQSVPIANGMICTCLVDMFGGPVPPENKWHKIPDEHLHSGMVVAYVNFVEFLEQVGIRGLVRSPEPACPDERPLIAKGEGKGKGKGKGKGEGIHTFHVGGSGSRCRK